MRDALAIISGLISIAATMPYILDTIKGKTRPSIVTWFTWGSLSAIAAVAALSNGSDQTAIFAGALSIANYGVVISSLRYGVKHYTLFDGVCQALAILGIILWRITGQPSLAILFVILSDLVGALPTYHHAWLKPNEETLSSFVFYVLADIFILVSLANWHFVTVGYPIYITASSLSIALLIIVRRRSVQIKEGL